MSSASPHEHAAADPERSEAGDVAVEDAKRRKGDVSQDPLFQKEEPQQGSPKRALLLWQFFFFPVLIVIGAVGVFFFINWLAADEQTPQGLLNTLVHGGENRQKQAAQQLAILIRNERQRVRDAEEKGDKDIDPPFYAAPGFQDELLRAFELARTEESKERQRALSRALGVAHVRKAIPVLLEVLYPGKDKSTAQELRRAAAAGLLHFESRAAEQAYLRMVKDKADGEVRAMGMSGLALLGLDRNGGRAQDDAAVGPALTRGLEDVHAGVRFNAAYGLARRGDARAVPFLKQSLVRDELKRLGIRPEFRQPALFNAMRGAARLGDPSLRPLVESLQEDGDETVREMAREALRRWRTPDGESTDGR